MICTPCSGSGTNDQRRALDTACSDAGSRSFNYTSYSLHQNTEFVATQMRHANLSSEACHTRSTSALRYDNQLHNIFLWHIRNPCPLLFFPSTSQLSSCSIMPYWAFHICGTLECCPKRWVATMHLVTLCMSCSMASAAAAASLQVPSLHSYLLLLLAHVAAASVQPSLRLPLDLLCVSSSPRARAQFCPAAHVQCLFLPDNQAWQVAGTPCADQHSYVRSRNDGCRTMCPCCQVTKAFHLQKEVPPVVPFDCVWDSLMSGAYGTFAMAYGAINEVIARNKAWWLCIGHFAYR